MARQAQPRSACPRSFRWTLLQSKTSSFCRICDPLVHLCHGSVWQGLEGHGGSDTTHHHQEAPIKERPSAALAYAVECPGDALRILAGVDPGLDVDSLGPRPYTTTPSA